MGLYFAKEVGMGFGPSSSENSHRMKKGGYAASENGRAHSLKELSEQQLRYRRNIVIEKLKSDLHLSIEHFSDGSRSAEFMIGNYSVNVLGIPGNQLSGEPVRWMRRARESYIEYWGGFPEGNEHLLEDETDHSDATMVYFAFVRGQDGTNNLVMTMRQTAYSLFKRDQQKGLIVATPEEELPIDVTIWNANKKTQQGVRSIRLHHYLQSLFRDYPDYHDFSVISRAGSTKELRDLKDLKGGGGAVFALIQALAMDSHPHRYVMCQHSPSLGIIFSLDDQVQMRRIIEFTATEQMLRFDKSMWLELDREHPVVQMLITYYLGYWSNPKVIEKRLSRLYGNAETADAVIEVMQDVVKELEEVIKKKGKDPSDIRDVIGVLCEPRNLKLLIPYISGEYDSFSKEAKIIREEILRTNRQDESISDGPVSSLLVPDQFQLNALLHLDAVKG